MIGVIIFLEYAHSIHEFFSQVNVECMNARENRVGIDQVRVSIRCCWWAIVTTFPDSVKIEELPIVVLFILCFFDGTQCIISKQENKLRQDFVQS